MGKIYFISDVHLGLQNKQHEIEKEKRLFSFLDSILHDAEELYILGDLFDYWFEYKHVVPKGFHRILTKLENVTRNGVTTHLIVGNHDFWVGKGFAAETGVHIYYEPITITLRGKRVLLHHGDGVNQADKGYKILRSILRNRINIFFYRLVHPDLGIGLARKSSQTSRNHSLNGHTQEQAALRTFALQKMDEGYDYVLMGHGHKPEHLTVANRHYINLGDWIKYYSYAVYDGMDVILDYWKDANEIGEST
jgi:UDP-2,3-diacylglucosamine hydrolase